MIWWDVVVPLVVYLAARALGADALAALLGASMIVGGRIAFALGRDRRLDGAAPLVAVMLAASVAVAVTTGDARVLLANKSAHVAAAGIFLLISAAVGRLVLFAVAKRVAARDAATVRRWNERFAESAAFRRTYVVMTIVWGAALLAEAAARVALVYSVPVDLAAVLSPLLLPGVAGPTALWSTWYGGRRERLTAGRSAGTTPSSAHTQTWVERRHERARDVDVHHP